MPALDIWGYRSLKFRRDNALALKCGELKISKNFRPYNITNFGGVFIDSKNQIRRTIFWNDEIDFPSDMIYEYGKLSNT